MSDRDSSSYYINMIAIDNIAIYMLLILQIWFSSRWYSDQV